MSRNSDQLERRLAEIEARLARLETGHLTSPAAIRMLSTSTETDFAVETPSGASLTGLTASRMVFLLGRSIMVLGGAFLLRYMTESGVVPPIVGFGLGLAYALLLIVLADRRGQSHPSEGVVHGVTGVMVAFPFLYESMVTLKLVGPLGGGLALGLVSGAGIFAAWHRRLRLLAWAFTLPALGLVAILGFATPRPVFFAWVLLALGLGTVLLAISRGWRLKQWLAAGLVNGVIFRLAIMAADQAAGPSPDALPVGPIQWLCLGLLVSYLGLFAYATLGLGQGVRVFPLIQSAAVLAVGFGGAVRLAEAAGHGSQALALFALAVALGGYVVSFTVVRRRHGRGGEFFYFASLALVFLLLGTRAVLEGGILVGAWLALGLLTAILAGRYDRVTLRSHAVAYLLLASLQAGLLRAAADAFTAGATTTWHQPGLMGNLTLLFTAAVAVLMNRQRGTQETGRWRKWPRLLAIALVLPGLAQLMVLGIVNLGGSAPPAADPRVVAAVRTGILALLAIGLALAARRPLLHDLRWLVYPLLGLGLLKVVLEDLRVGSPLGLFFAFAMIGGALILAPRLARHHADQST